MFRCSECGDLSQPCEQPVRVIVETREKIYPARPKAIRRGSGLTLRWIEDPGGIGTEIVHEELRHTGCISNRSVETCQ